MKPILDFGFRISDLRGRRFAVALGWLLSVAVTAPAAMPWGENLWPNGSFEAGMDGWRASRGPGNATVEALELADGCAGERSLHVVNPPELGTNLESPVIELSPGWHLLAFWYRFALRGEGKPQQLVYVDRYTGNGAARRRESLYFFYHSEIADGGWQMAFLTFRLRDGDTGVGVRFVADAPAAALSVDAIQVRRLLPPATPGTVVSIETDAYGTDRLADPQAANGFAHRVEEGKQTRGGKTGGGTRFTSPPGFYRATYRFRQEAPGSGTVLGLQVGGDGGKAMDIIDSREFGGHDDYQEFTLYWLYPFGSGCFPGWDWRGTGTYRFDCVTLEQLQPLTARDAWNMLAAGVDIGKILPPAPLLAAGTNAWLAAGLYVHETGLPDALDAGGRGWEASALTTVRGGGLVLSPPMPSLGPLATVGLANIPSRAISPIAQLALRRLVEDGGTLLVAGGFHAFGHGGYQGSFLEELLPVQIKRTFDLTPVDGTLREATWWFPEKLGGCAWVHDVAVKPGAQVLYRVGDHPGVVRWQVGRGNVVAVPATVLGTPAKPFWNQPGWAKTLARLLTYQPPSKQ